MSDDMLSRIRKRRKRPSVRRDTSLVNQGKAEESQSKPTPPEPTSPQAQLNDLQAQIDALPQVGDRRNVRLETSIDTELPQFCSQNNVTIETFLEAAFLACSQDAELKASVLEAAQARLQQRKQAGQLRRLQSQLKKLSQSR